MIGFLSFISKINCSALSCLFFIIFIQVLLSGVSSAVGSCLLTQGNISRLALCLVRIALKLARFRKPTFIGLKFGAGRTTYISHNYLTSILQVLTSSYKLS